MDSEGFHNIDELPLGKLLQASYGGRSAPKKKLNVAKMIEKGFRSASTSGKIR